ncbi:MAG: hypothetical protein ACP5C3_07740 [Methanomicrobiales archaeon]
MLKFPIIKRNKSLFILSIPVIITFFITLIPTLKYQWPLSWDVYYHVHMAKLYMEVGITFFDPLTFAPYGRPIFYPPLLHYFIAFSSLILKSDPFLIARLLQPFLASLIVLSFSYAANKLYNLYTGVFAGFLLMFSVPYFRFMLPIPEGMALILFPMVIYYYFTAIENNNYKMAIISGILSGLILLTHSLTALCLLFVLAVYTLIIKINRKGNLKIFGLLLIPMLILASIWWIPLVIMHGFIFNNPEGVILPLTAYVKFFGIITIIFALIGCFLAFKRRLNKDILILSGGISLILLSQIYWLGISILSDRILTFSIFFIVILAACGLLNIRKYINKNMYRALVFIIIFFAVFSGVTGANNLAPFINSEELDISQWFKINGDKERVVITSNYEMDPLIVSISRQPVSEGGYGPGSIQGLNKKKYLSGNFSYSDVINDNVGYIVLELNMTTPNNTIPIYSNTKYKICIIDLKKI